MVAAEMWPGWPVLEFGTFDERVAYSPSVPGAWQHHEHEVELASVLRTSEPDTREAKVEAK